MALPNNDDEETICGCNNCHSPNLPDYEWQVLMEVIYEEESFNGGLLKTFEEIFSEDIAAMREH